MYKMEITTAVATQVLIMAIYILIGFIILQIQHHTVGSQFLGNGDVFLAHYQHFVKAFCAGTAGCSLHGCHHLLCHQLNDLFQFRLVHRLTCF